jgi:hypothetical protein
MALWLLQCSWSVLHHYYLGARITRIHLLETLQWYIHEARWLPRHGIWQPHIFPTVMSFKKSVAVPVAARSTAPSLLRSWVRIPPGAWMFVCYECCVLSGRGLCDELITRPEEFYQLWYVALCVIETLSTRSQTSINSDWTHEIFSLEGTS